MASAKTKVRRDIYFGLRGMERLIRLMEEEGLDASAIVRDALVKREQGKITFQHQVSAAVLDLAEQVDMLPDAMPTPAERKEHRGLLNAARRQLASLLGSDFAARGIEGALRELLHVPAESPLSPTSIDRDHLYPIAQVERFLVFLQGHSPELVPATVLWRQAREEEGLDAHGVLEPALRFPKGELALAFEPQYVIVQEDPWEEKATGQYALAYIAAELAEPWQRFLQQS